MLSLCSNGREHILEFVNSTNGVDTWRCVECHEEFPQYVDCFGG